MTSSKAIRAIFLACIGSLISGCGLKTPEITLDSDPNAASFLVNKIINHVRCELKYGIRYAVWYDTRIALEQAPRKRRIAWIDTWGAKLALKLVVKEKSSINPGVSAINPLRDSVKPVLTGLLKSGQSYTTGFGGSVSSQATRTINLEFFFDFASDFLGRDFDRSKPPEKCTPEGPFLVEGDLKIAEFIDMATFPYQLDSNVSAKIPQATSQEVEFVVTIDANITPTLKLARVATSGGSAGFFDVNRSTTNDIIVSIGPSFGGVPSEALSETHFLAKQQSNLYSITR